MLDMLLSKESIFAVLFVFLLFKQFKQTEKQQDENKFREDKLYSFLDGMKTEFAKLVKQYERLSDDVEDIKEELQYHKKQEKKKENDKNE